MHGMDTKAEKFYQAYTAPSKAGAAGLKPEYVGVVDKYNRALEGIYRRDSRYLNELASAITSKGSVEDVTTTDKYLTISYRDGEKDKIPYPKTDKAQDIESFKDRVGEILQTSTNYKGKNVPGGLPSYVEPFYKREGITFEEGEKVPFSKKEKDAIVFTLTKKKVPINTETFLEALDKNDALFGLKPKRINSKMLRVGDRYYEVTEDKWTETLETYLRDSNAGTITDIDELPQTIKNIVKLLDAEKTDRKEVEKALIKAVPGADTDTKYIGDVVVWNGKEYKVRTLEGKNNLLIDISEASEEGEQQQEEEEAEFNTLEELIGALEAKFPNVDKDAIKAKAQTMWEGR
jgi:hypothetical protein